MTSDAELAELSKLASGQRVLELGSALGRSALAMAKTADQVHCVDHFRGDPHYGFGDHLAAFFKEVRNVKEIIVHVGSFDDVCPLLKPSSFGLVFIDGYHTYEQVWDDINLARRLVSAPGWLAFHDYTVKDAGFGVKRAVNEYFKRKPDRVVDSLALVRYNGYWNRPVPQRTRKQAWQLVRED